VIIFYLCLIILSFVKLFLVVSSRFDENDAKPHPYPHLRREAFPSILWLMIITMYKPGANGSMRERFFGSVLANWAIGL